MFLILVSLVLLLRPSAGEEEEEGDDYSDEEQLELCRLYPTWQDDDNENISWERCSEAWGYVPYENKEDLLRDAPEEYQGEEWYEDMEACMAEKAKERRQEYASMESFDDSEEPYVSEIFPSEDEPVLALIEYALSEEEAATFVDLSHCVKEHHSRQYVRRSFADESSGETVQETGGNDCTFVGGFLQLFAPGVMAQMCRVFRAAHQRTEWYNLEEEGIPYKKDPCTIGMRTAEHLQYSPHGYSHVGGHEDIHTVYTIVVALADKENYGGGEYYIQPKAWGASESQGRIVVKPDRLSALMFLGEEHHGVQRILSGKREMIAIELWAYGDTPVGVNRPQVYEYEKFQRTGSYKGTACYEGFRNVDPNKKYDEEEEEEL